MSSFHHQELIPGKMVWLNVKILTPLRVKIFTESKSIILRFRLLWDDLMLTIPCLQPPWEKSKGKTFVFYRTDSMWTGYCHSRTTALAFQLSGSHYTAWAQNKKLHGCRELGSLKNVPHVGLKTHVNIKEWSLKFSNGIGAGIR